MTVPMSKVVMTFWLTVGSPLKNKYPTFNSDGASVSPYTDLKSKETMSLSISPSVFLEALCDRMIYYV